MKKKLCAQINMDYFRGKLNNTVKTNMYRRDACGLWRMHEKRRLGSRGICLAPCTPSILGNLIRKECCYR